MPTLLIEHDEDGANPRENFENLGTMACWHRRYKLGDVQPKEDPKEWLQKNVPKGSLQLPLFLFDHSGITIRTGNESFKAADPQGWDWGRLGLIFVTPERMAQDLKEYKDGEERLKAAKEVLEAEVKVYDLYLTGQVWGYVFTDDKGEEDS